jgi:valine--pyruvate aminotransferase
MELDLSWFGRKLGSTSGILELMDDLGRAMNGSHDVLMLGGGNPAAIPEMRKLWRDRSAELLADADRFDAMLNNYDTPQGRPALIDAVVEYFNNAYGWGLTPDNVALTNGSQTAWFCLLNMFAGRFPGGRTRKILLPITPEYIGYADQGLEADFFRAVQPSINILDGRTFKYGIDFDRLDVSDEIGAIAVSRPTNPTGNAISDEELERLSSLAAARGVPLLIDNAYGLPFPHILFREIRLRWERHIVLSFSLSKLGLPGVRTGIVIAAPAIIRAITGINAVVGLANGNFGPELVAPLLRDGRLVEICRSRVGPFYEARLRQAVEWFSESLPPGLPVYLHECDGTFFLWVWCRDLPIHTSELYQRLKRRRVLVVPGHYFFFGLEAPWRHREECLRINYSQPPGVVREGMRIIAEEIARAYRG